MSFSKGLSITSQRFGARQLAVINTRQLGQGGNADTQVDLHVYQLNLNPDATAKAQEEFRQDVTWLRQRAEELDRLKAQKLPLVPFTPGYHTHAPGTPHRTHHDNHLELAEDCVTIALKEATRPLPPDVPRADVYVALTPKNQQVVGMLVNNRPRRRHEHEPYRTTMFWDASPTQGSINFIATFRPGLVGVGKALTAASAEAMAARNAPTIATITETPDYTPAALPFYQQFGFQVQADRLPQWRPPHVDPDFHGLPCQADLADFLHASRQTLTAPFARHTTPFHQAPAEALRAQLPGVPSSGNA